MTTGWATAVLVEMATLPFESVEVTGTGTATGVVGRVVAGVGEGVMMMLLDAGAGRVESTRSSSLAGGRIAGAESGTGAGIGAIATGVGEGVMTTPLVADVGGFGITGTKPFPGS